MDLEALSEQGKTALLTLPRSDLEVSTVGPTSPSKNDEAETDDNNNNASLMLLQLPTGWSPSDLKKSHFVASSTTEQQQVALVSESKKTSFAVHRVETSNVLVLVPPPLSNNNDDESTTGGATKKSKVMDGKTLLPVASRLLTKGGSGASFLELREKSLAVVDLLKAFEGYVWDPYNNNNDDDDDNNNNDDAADADLPKGRTIEQVANELQSSQYQVRQGLNRISQAFALPDTYPPSHVLLSEEVEKECYNHILFTLSEVDDYQDYAAKGIQDPQAFVKDVVQRMSAEERFAHVDAVVRHYLGTLCRNSSSRRSMMNFQDKIRLDVRKVAVCVARRLFQKQSSPWEETLFLSRWQSELPGVGDFYQVDLEMLRGIAVDIVVGEEKEEERFWKYLPVDKMPSDPSAAFSLLFSEKPKWRMEELQPYVDRYADSSSSAGDLLLRFTKVTTEEKDGISRKYYTKL